MQKDRMVFGALCPNQLAQQRHKVEITKKEKMMVPRSSSPVTVYVELPCIIEQAFSTIAWDDLEECATGMTQDSSSLGYRANDCISEEHDLQDYALDFMADSPSTLESSLSPAELVPFEGCVIPPLTPQPDFSVEDSVATYADESNPAPTKDDWYNGIAQCNGIVLGQSVEVNHQLHKTIEEKQQEIDCLQERNHHLKQLASRAKHLAAVLEKLMTVSDANTGEPPHDKVSLSPCKRQRLDEGYETETDSVENMLRDISTRCNAVLHNAATGTKQPDSIRMFGSFSGLQTSFSNTCSMRTDGLEAGESSSSFRASVREHSTIKTQVFAHGHAFTTRTQHGGYRFRWVPNPS